MSRAPLHCLLHCTGAVPSAGGAQTTALKSSNTGALAAFTSISVALVLAAGTLLARLCWIHRARISRNERGAACVDQASKIDYVSIPSKTNSAR